MQSALTCIFEICNRYTENRGTHGISHSADYEEAGLLLNKSQRVIIVTGFCIASCGVGETDGPLGSVALATTLEGLGKKVLFVTDHFNEEVLKALIKENNLKANLLIRSTQEPEPIFAELWQDFKPDLVMGIERPGRNIKGTVHSMSNEEISSFCPDTDFLFFQAVDKKIPTLCIGDGGNEVGMGKAKEIIRRQVPHGIEIAAAFSADILLAAGVSNWGALGLIAVLSLLNESNLLHNNLTEEKMMSIMKETGAVDGVLKVPGMTVDGYPFSESLKVLDDLHNCINTYLQKKSTS